MQECVVPGAISFSEIDSLQDVEDFFLVKKANQGFLCAFLRDVKDDFGQLSALWR